MNLLSIFDHCEGDPIEACSIGSWDNSFSFDKLVKSFGISGEREHRSAVFFKVNLGEHLSAYCLISYSEDKFVAPLSCLADCFDHMRQRQEKCAFGVYALSMEDCGLSWFITQKAGSSANWSYTSDELSPSRQFRGSLISALLQTTKHFV